MKTNKFILVITLITSLLSCSVENNHSNASSAHQNTKTSDIEFEVAKGYFIKNTVPDDTLLSPVIENQQAFDQLTGIAAVMGESGKPTTIDFSKQFVIALVEKSTDSLTTIRPISLKKEADNLVMDYEVTIGTKQSFTARPATFLVVNAHEKRQVILRKKIIRN